MPAMATSGIIEDGESPEDLVRRETVEEANLKVGEIEFINSVMLTPGACSESCTIFAGRVDSSAAGGIFGLASENENILVKAIPFVEVRAMLDRAEIDNVIAVVALQWLALHRDSLRKRWS